MRKKLVLQAPAKINLFLKILNKRPDGYHNILSLMQMVGLYDKLAFEEVPEGIHLEVKQGRLPSDRSNLVFRAADRLQKEALAEGFRPKGVRISLTKNIPVSAGLGGGSSDAAATFIALNRFWGLNWPRKRLAGLGLEIGSDLPFFFDGPTAWVSGRGEYVEGVAPAFQGWVVLVHPEIEVSTASVYAAFSEKTGLTKERSLLKITGSTLKKPTARTVLEQPSNDLEGITLSAYPQLKVMKAFLADSGGEGVLMSGSGSTLFALFRDYRKADAVSGQVQDHFRCRVRLVEVLQKSHF